MILLFNPFDFWLNWFLDQCVEAQKNQMVSFLKAAKQFQQM